MKIGIQYDKMSVNGFSRWGENVFEKLSRIGFDCVDYSLAYETHPIYNLPPDKAKAFLEREKKLISDAGLTVSQTHSTWGWPPVENDSEQLKDWTEKTICSIRATALLGAKYCVVHPIMPFGWQHMKFMPNYKEETWQANLDFFTELEKTAKECDVIICVENMPMPDFAIGSPDQVLKLVKAVDSDYVKICLDTGHVAVYENLSLADETRKLGDYIKVLHVHDNRYFRDAHMVPLYGVIDWKAFISALKDINFNGVFSLESDPPSKLPDDLFEQATAFLYGVAKHVLSL